MSKFIDAIQAKLTGRRVLEMPHITARIDREPVTASGDFGLMQYDIGVEWKVRTHCKPVDLENMLRNATRQLREDVYGQFRGRALEIQRAAYEHDMDKVHLRIRDLLIEIDGGSL